jgi:hypothetical protein
MIDSQISELLRGIKLVVSKIQPSKDHIDRKEQEKKISAAISSYHAERSKACELLYSCHEMFHIAQKNFIASCLNAFFHDEISVSTCDLYLDTKNGPSSGKLVSRVDAMLRKNESVVFEFKVETSGKLPIGEIYPYQVLEELLNGLSAYYVEGKNEEN